MHSILVFPSALIGTQSRPSARNPRALVTSDLPAPAAPLAPGALLGLSPYEVDRKWTAAQRPLGKSSAPPLTAIRGGDRKQNQKTLLTFPRETFS